MDHPFARRLWVSAGTLLFIPSVAYQGLQAVDLMSWRTSETRSAAVSSAGVSGRITEVDIATGGTIRITARQDGSDEVTVTKKVRRGLQQPSYSSRVNGSTLVLRSSCSVFLSVACGIDLTLTVPPGTKVIARSSAGAVRIKGILAEVQAESSAGGVSVIDSEGKVRARSTAGNVTLTRVAGSVEAHSTAGTVTGEDLTVTKVVAKSTAGDVRLTFSTAPTEVSASSTAGEVVIGLPRGNEFYRTTVSSTSESPRVDVRSDPSSNRTITARSTAGNVTVVYADTID